MMTGHKKDCFTVMLCCTADGRKLPPYIVSQAEDNAKGDLLNRRHRQGAGKRLVRRGDHQGLGEDGLGSTRWRHFKKAESSGFGCLSQPQVGADK